MTGEAPLLVALPQLEAVLERHILPHLSVHDIGRLACVSSALKEAIAGIVCSLWTTAASRWLPAKHPALQQTDLAALKAALAASRLARHNIRQGSFTALDLPTGAISPDGRMHARVDRDQHSGGLQLQLTSINLLHGKTITAEAMPARSPLNLTSVSLCCPIQWLDSERLMLCQRCHHDSKMGIYIYQAAPLELLAEAAVPTLEPRITSLHRDCNGRYLAVRRAAECSVIFDLSKLEVVRELQCAASASWAVRWHSAMEQRLAHLDDDGIARIGAMDAETQNDVVLQLSHQAALGKWSPDGEHFSMKVYETTTCPARHLYMSCIVLSTSSGAAVLRLPNIGDQHCFSPDSCR